jgi:hypothetical protein
MLSLRDEVERDGRPGIIHGLTHACVDCAATGALVLLPGKVVIAHVFHSIGCPTLTGATRWEVVP